MDTVIDLIDLIDLKKFNDSVYIIKYTCVFTDWTKIIFSTSVLRSNVAFVNSLI